MGRSSGSILRSLSISDHHKHLWVMELTKKEDAAILTYLDHHWMMKPARRSEKKCSKIVETEEIFRWMEVDKVVEGRSWKSLKQRWNSVLKWRDFGEKEIR